MSSEGKKSRKKSIFVMCSIAVIFVLCCVTAVLLLNHPVLICSDAGGVEFVTEEDRITYVSVRGQYPYLRVVCPLDKEVVQDAAGNVEEEIYIYTMQAEPTFLGSGMMNLKIDVETSDEIIFTYILKFADKDVKITNGKVVE